LGSRSTRGYWRKGIRGG